MERWEGYLAIAAICAVWIFILLTLYCYCPFAPPVDLLIPFKVIIIMGAFFWVIISVLAFRNGRTRKLISLLSLAFFIITSIKFLPLFSKFAVYVDLPKSENILFCWTFGSIVIIAGMVVLTYFTFKT